MNTIAIPEKFTDYALDGINCIEASAGTGKTYTITHLFIRLIVEKDLPLDAILVVTFTNAATDELRARIRSLLKTAYEIVDSNFDDAIINGYKKNAELISYLKKLCEDSNSEDYRLQIALRLQLALHDIDNAHVYTIHSFCRQALSEFAFESGSLFGSEVVTDASPYNRRIIEEYFYKEIAPLGKEFMYYFISQVPKEGDFVQWCMKIINKLPDDPGIAILPNLPFDKKKIKQKIDALCQKITAIQQTLLNEKDIIQKNFSDALSNDVLNLRSYNEEKFINVLELLSHLTFYSFIDKNARYLLDIFSMSSINDKLKGPYKKGDKTYTFHTIFEQIQQCRDIFTDIKLQVIAAYRHFLLNYDTYYDRYRDEWNILSFKDILKDMHTALMHGTESPLATMIRSHYKAALIDEFQDTDPLQYAIFNTIFNKDGYTLYIIGDPKQAIYSFRGADVFAYCKARESAQTKYTLRYSFRSTQMLTKAINTIFGTMKNPFVLDEIEYSDVKSSVLPTVFDNEPSLHIWFVDTENGEKHVGIQRAKRIIAQRIAKEISSLVQENLIQYNDIAVLVRKNKEARLVQEILQQYGIHSVLYSTESIFESDEAMELLQVMEAIVNPSSAQKIFRALITSLYGYTASDIDTLKDDTMLDIIKMRFIDYYKAWKSRGFIQCFQLMMHGTTISKRFDADTDTVSSRLLHYPDGERVITNLYHCAEILSQVETTKKLDALSLVEWFKKSILIKSDVEDKMLRLESDANAVKIVTVHFSKGLEYPVVFCPYLFNVGMLDDLIVFHEGDSNRTTNVCFKLNAGDDKGDVKNTLYGIDYTQYINKALKEQLAEDMRVAYVAMTRAKYRCYVGWGNINSTKISALNYLFHYRFANDITIDNFLNKNFNNNATSEELIDELEKLVSLSDDSIALEVFNTVTLDKAMVTRVMDNKVVEPERIQKDISPGWQLTSYTALSYTKEDEKGDEVYTSVPHDEKHEPTIFTFPAGSVTGLCIHSIFEEVDFASGEDAMCAIVAEKLQHYRFDVSWTDTIVTMVRNVLSIELNTAVPLNRITRENRQHEIEFYYPVERLNRDECVQLFTMNNLFDIHYGSALQRLSFGNIQGFMHGYIDMVFRYNNAYYIVDWKTNQLGYTLNDYHHSKLKSAMIDHFYFLQYHIYAVALHRHLSMLLGKSYNYNKHFGGVFYIFVRGVDADKGGDYGIFYDKPDCQFIEQLNNYLYGVKV